MPAALNTAKFIEKANEKHGGKYGYSKVEYVNSKERVCITCKVHGDFWQEPDSHLKGHGCRLCGRDSLARTTEQFINEAQSVHGDNYGYSKVKYVNCRTKVCITCSEHGEFWQTPTVHLMGGPAALRVPVLPKCTLKRANKCVEITPLNLRVFECSL